MEQWWRRGGSRNTPVAIDYETFAQALREEDPEMARVAIEGIREAQARGYTLIVLDRGVHPEIRFTKGRRVQSTFK